MCVCVGGGGGSGLSARREREKALGGKWGGMGGGGCQWSGVVACLSGAGWGSMTAGAGAQSTGNLANRSASPPYGQPTYIP